MNTPLTHAKVRKFLDYLHGTYYPGDFVGAVHALGVVLDGTQQKFLTCYADTLTAALQVKELGPIEGYDLVDRAIFLEVLAEFGE